MNYFIQSRNLSPNVQLSSLFKNNVKSFNFTRKICLLNSIFYSNIQQNHQIIQTFKPLNYSNGNIKIPQYKNIIRSFNFIRRIKREEQEKFSFIKLSIKEYDELQNISSSNVPILIDNSKILNQFEMKFNSIDNYFKIADNNNNPIEININSQKHKLTCTEILKIIHYQFSFLSNISKIFENEINKLNKYLKESYNRSNFILI